MPMVAAMARRPPMASGRARSREQAARHGATRAEIVAVLDRGSLHRYSVHRSAGRERIIGISGVDETGVAAGAQKLLHLLDRLADLAARVARLEPALEVDQCVIGGV